jgi:hypothetical protein
MCTSRLHNQSPASRPPGRSSQSKNEPKNIFQNWIIEVDAILTPEEREAWTKLRTDEEREALYRNRMA